MKVEELVALFGDLHKHAVETGNDRLQDLVAFAAQTAENEVPFYAELSLQQAFPKKLLGRDLVDSVRPS